MGYYNEKQHKFASYLCRILGMTDDSFIESFLNYYAINFAYYKRFKSGWFWVTDAINQLIIERNIRRNRYALKIKERLSYFRATDLANLTFCPASFSISTTFQITHPNMEKERQMGERLHEKLNLVKRVSKYHKTKSLEHKIFEQEDIKVILDSEVIYSGHNKTAKRAFFDNHHNVACEPDYIFKDKNSKYFVVEEKFHYKRDPKKPTYEDNYNDWHGVYDESHEEFRLHEIKEWEEYKPTFYLNHKVQLITYLKCVNAYLLEYGYLVYWYYDYDNEQNPYIHKVATKKIMLDTFSLRLFNRVLTAVNQLVSTGEINFDGEKISPFKCSRCVVNKYCGHKTKRFNELSYPYKHDYLELYSTTF